MVKNKVVLKERDVWSDLANFIGEMVAKYAEAMDLDSLPDPDHYLLMKCQTAHCGRGKSHFIFGGLASPIVPYRNLTQTTDGITADCRSLV